ncbi:hypothetical protein GGS23DRAFT_160992 [Durotheca rogersii]|uniref:uncharacterized protein n=1 Tax=Durotheca rogersii TaxID=419775 RepID=UPI00221E3822|nr:uncharacterized protein GGS23DRAFT_160992 [Durotheca rogersii]KAI5861275.1 hypothetical protein GGS23DRAFT_160992 [Durotheca rogersii]
MDLGGIPDFHGGAEIGLNGALIGLSTLLYGLRIWVRVYMTKSPGLDDGIAAIAYVLLVAQSVLDINSVSFGNGVHRNEVPNDLLPKFFESVTIQTLVYFWALAMARLAILAFLPRLAQDRCINWTAWTVAAVIVAQTLVAFIYRLTECTPVADNFKPPLLPGMHCVALASHNKMMVGHAVVGVAVDVAILVLPIWVICTKMMWSKKTLQIVLVLSVGLFAAATGIVRLTMMTAENFYDDITYQMATLGIWTNLEGHVGLWCGCFPALQPILRVLPGKIRFLGTMDERTKRTREGPSSHMGATARKEFDAGRSSIYALASESQRAIVLLEMGKDDAARRDREMSLER